jgi:hypothetical protein
MDNWSIFLALIDLGVDVNRLWGGENCNPLQYAVFKQRLLYVAALLAAGAEVNTMERSSHASSTLHFAVRPPALKEGTPYDEVFPGRLSRRHGCEMLTIDITNAAGHPGYWY